MIKEFSYPFSDLVINTTEIAEILGYPDGNLPEPFNEYLDEALNFATKLPDIKGAFYRTSRMNFPDKKDRIIVDGIEFCIGKTVAKELRNSESVFLFICTAGNEISKLAQELIKGDNPVLGYVYNVLGSATVEAATDCIQNEIRKMAASSGNLITNRYSPGYCKWSVADQHKLFSFFPENCCGIRLTESALMHPIKSVSGIIGEGKEVNYRKYICDLCDSTECFYRNRH